MTETGERGAKAYRQAYEHVRAGGAYRTKRGRLKGAMAYLRVTADPPLTPEEDAAAKAAMREMRKRGATP